MEAELKSLFLKAKQMESEQNAKLDSQEYVIELSDEELKIVTAEELAEMEKSAMEFDGFLGFTVRGRLVR
jgi:hypothetical protein